jgi:hypothetical protein
VTFVEHHLLDPNRVVYCSKEYVLRNAMENHRRVIGKSHTYTCTSLMKLFSLFAFGWERSDKNQSALGRDVFVLGGN